MAVLGTTISPYLFFWQASEEAEDVRDNRKEHPLKWAPWQARKQFERIKVDTVVGMGFSNVVSLVHYFDDGSDFARGGNHRHSDFGPGGQGT